MMRRLSEFDHAVCSGCRRVRIGRHQVADLVGLVIDALSVPERKNPAGLLAAFTQVARESRRPVHLLMKVNHAESEPGFIADLQRRSAGLPVTLTGPEVLTLMV